MHPQNLHSVVGNERHRPRRTRVRSLLFVLAASPCFLSAASASEIPEWPREREERLSAVESKILDVQRELFTARVRNDEAKQTELKKQMKELEREQVRLLRATGQFPRR